MSTVQREHLDVLGRHLPVAVRVQISDAGVVGWGLVFILRRRVLRKVELSIPLLLINCIELIIDISTASYDTYQSGAATGLYGCIATVTSDDVVATMVQENDEPTAVTSSGPITVIAEPLYMVWHESDTTLHAGSDSSSLLAAMNMAMPSATTTATSTPTPSSGTDSEDEAEEEEEEEGTGMTNAAVAGISAGFAVCGMLIAMLSYLAFVRPKRRNATEPTPASGSGSKSGQSPRGGQAWNDGAVYANEHQTPTPNTIDKTHSLANQHSAETLDSRDPQMSHALRSAHQDKDEFLIEQKMLLR